MKKTTLAGMLLVIPFLLANTDGCSDADVASNNLARAAEQFEVPRKVTLYNVINDIAMVSVEGYCSVEFFSGFSEVTCKNSEGQFLKHMLAQSDNTTMVVEQLSAVGVSTYQYRVLIKPSLIIPDFDIVAPGMEGNSNISTGTDG